MGNYLQGFIDGYEKAMEHSKKESPEVSITIDGKEVAKEIYKDVVLLQEREKQVRNSFIGAK